MWYEVNDQAALDFLMESVGDFHDSCMKEMVYVSGAFVGDDLAMYPINNQRTLKVVFQIQSSPISMIEMEFMKLKCMQLSPVSENYTCEILDATMILKEGCVIWCDCGGLTEADIQQYCGTVISAEKLRWRVIDGFMGDSPFYHSDI